MARTSSRHPLIGLVPPHGAQPALARKEPYEKPRVETLDLANMMQTLDECEGEIYKEFNALADRAEHLLEDLEEIERAMQDLSEKLDSAKLSLAKVQFVEEVQETERPQ